MYSDEWRGWPWLLRGEVKQLPKWGEFVQEVRAEGINSPQKYREFQKKFKRNLWPSAPNEFYASQWVDWSWLWSGESKKFPSWDNFVIQVQDAALNSPDDYRAIRKEKKWPRHPERTYKAHWKGWPDLLDYRVVEFAKWEDFLREVREWAAGGNKQREDYFAERKRNWPSAPQRVYKEHWKGWPWLLLKEARQLPAWDAFVQQVRDAKISSARHYRSEYKARKWPANPERDYGVQWRGWPWLLLSKNK